MWNRLVTTKRRWGYMVWGIAVALILASEAIAAFDRHLLPFPTISDTTGHVERLHHWFKLIVVLVIVFPLFSLARFGGDTAAGWPARTRAGRLSLGRRAPPASPRPLADEL